MTVVHLDGTEDWIFQSQAVLAWIGRTLSLTPLSATKLVGLAYLAWQQD